MADEIEGESLPGETSQDGVSPRMRVLEMIESGQITTEEGLRLLESMPDDEDVPIEGVAAIDLSGESEIPEAAGTSAEAEDASQAGPAVLDGKRTNVLPPDAEKWRRYWMIPVWIGVIATVLSGVLMYQAFRASQIGFWFVCAAFPFALGILILTLGVQARTAPWLHLRVQQKPGERPQRIAFSFPIPVRPTAWFLRTFGNKIKGLEDTSLDEIILALGETARAGDPLYIQADEGEDGDKVEIYIG
jgi:hypothetical protein